MSKISWSKALVDYIKDDTSTLADIAAKYGIDYGHLRNVAGQEKWSELREEIKLKSDKRLTEIVTETIADIKIRHANIGKAMQAQGLNAIKAGVRPMTANDVRLYVLTGIRIEREALGLDDPDYKDPNYEKFKQFSFIFNMTEEELERFNKALNAQMEKNKEKIITQNAEEVKLLNNGEFPAKDGEIVQ